MPKIDIYNQAGEKVDAVDFADSVFSITPNIPVMHQVCKAILAARRQGTHNTKTRGQVSGGGRKPYRQKGTGRARQGSIRAPHYRGGGTVFGPHPRSYAFKVNNKEVKLAMRSALSGKLADDELLCIDSFDFEKPSTKAAIKVLESFGIDGKVTLVIDTTDVNSILSFRNIPGMRIISVGEANTYDLIDNKKLVFTLSTLKRLEEVLV